MSWFSDTFSSVSDFFTNLWDNVIQPDMKSVEEVAIAFFSAAATSAAQQLGTQGLKLITDAVTAAETQGGTGVEKLAAAQSQIVTDLSTAGITAATNIVNAAIEGAVAQLKTVQTSAPAVEMPAPEEAPALQQ